MYVKTKTASFKSPRVPLNTSLINGSDEINGWLISGCQLITAVKLEIKKKKDLNQQICQQLWWSNIMSRQRKPAHVGTMDLSFQCTCKIPQPDVHPHARLTGGTAVGSSGSPVRHAFLSPRAHVNTHLRRGARAGTHSHTPPSPPTWAGWPLKQLQLPGTDRQTD